MAARIGDGTFPKSDFLAGIHHIRQETFQPHVIKAGWREAGIQSFKSIEKLRGNRERSSSPILEIYDGDEDSEVNSGPSAPNNQRIEPDTPTTI